MGPSQVQVRSCRMARTLNTGLLEVCVLGHGERGVSCLSVSAAKPNRTPDKSHTGIVLLRTVDRTREHCSHNPEVSTGRCIDKAARWCRHSKTEFACVNVSCERRNIVRGELRVVLGRQLNRASSRNAPSPKWTTLVAWLGLCKVSKTLLCDFDRTVTVNRNHRML
jgi:hypothetical protein